MVEGWMTRSLTKTTVEEDKVEEPWEQVVSRKEKKKRKAQKGPDEKVGMLGIVEPQQVNVIGTGDWEVIEMAVDSGASESVTHEEELRSVQVTDGEAKRRGVKYEVADGTLIPNMGEKNFVAIGETGVMRHMKLQVCDVNKSLLSVRRVTQAGNRVVFENGGGYIEDTETGEQMWMEEKEGMYVLKLWVRKGGKAPEAGFTWQD
jgi:hypothetical protein